MRDLRNHPRSVAPKTTLLANRILSAEDLESGGVIRRAGADSGAEFLHSSVKTIDTDFPLVTCRKPEEPRGCITGTLEGRQRLVTLVTASAEACRFFRPSEVAKTHMMNRSALIFSLFLSLTALASTAVAQSNSVSKANPANEKGFASYTEFGGTTDSDGQVSGLKCGLQLQPALRSGFGTAHLFCAGSEFHHGQQHFYEQSRQPIA